MASFANRNIFWFTFSNIDQKFILEMKTMHDITTCCAVQNKLHALSETRV